MLILNTWKDEDKRELKIHQIKKTSIWLGIVFFTIVFWGMVFSSCCHASIIIDYNTREITNIIYAEQSNPKATYTLLNTYYHSRNKGESLLQSLKRQSNAYRYHSKEYIKANNGKLNRYEQNLYIKILKQVEKFTPQKEWKYVKHESLHFYHSFDEMIIKLHNKWGDNIDYKNCKLIEGQYYFKRK